MHKFKAGDTVEVIDSPELHHWNNYKEVINKEFIISDRDLRNGSYHPNGNYYCINVPWENVKLVVKQWDE